MIKASEILTDKPFEVGLWAVSLLNALISFPVVFGWWQPTPDQLGLVTLIGNLLLQPVIYSYQKRFATPRANPTTADGIPMQPIAPRTRGIAKG